MRDSGIEEDGPDILDGVRLRFEAGLRMVGREFEAVFEVVSGKAYKARAEVGVSSSGEEESFRSLKVHTGEWLVLCYICHREILKLHRRWGGKSHEVQACEGGGADPKE